MTDVTDLVRLAAQRATDMAWTRCAAEEIRLRRLLAEREIDIADEMQGELSEQEKRK